MCGWRATQSGFHEPDGFVIGRPDGLSPFILLSVFAVFLAHFLFRVLLPAKRRPLAEDAMVDMGRVGGRLVKEDNWIWLL